MEDFSARAEFDRLRSVRVHKPGIEVLPGILDPKPNLFLSNFSLQDAQSEHDKLVSVLEDSGVDVHYLHEDLNRTEALDRLLAAFVETDFSDLKQWRQAGIKDLVWNGNAGDSSVGLSDISPSLKLQIIASQVQIIRKSDDGTDTLGRVSDKNDPRGWGDERGDRSSLKFREPLANLYFQRDQQILTARGPVIGRMGTRTRFPELKISRAAWEAIGADIATGIEPDGILEGGDYLPVGDFALLGVSAYVDRDASGKSVGRKPLRTNDEAGEQLLENDAFGHDEIGFVRANLSRAKELADAGDAAMEVMHLDTWLNVVSDGLAVARPRVMEEAVVDVHERAGESYELTEVGLEFDTYLQRNHDFEVLPIPEEDKLIGSNLLTLDDGVVLPVRRDDYEDSSLETTIDKMLAEGVEVVPDGRGLVIDNLRNGFGGIHCMTTPLNRG